VCIYFEGGDGLKFGDVIMAVASLAMINILLTSVLMGIFLPVISTGGKDVAVILSILLASLIVGYMFAAKIQEESRRRAIGSIVVLFALANVLFVMALFANPLTSPALKDSLDSIFPLRL
jgi:ethanolamine transporter EutH